MAVCPLIMKIELLAHAVVPLGVMGCLCLTTGLLCHFFLPKTKGSTAETFDDSSEFSRFNAWSPRVIVRKKKKTQTTETEEDRVEMVESYAIDGHTDEFAVRILVDRMNEWFKLKVQLVN